MPVIKTISRRPGDRFGYHRNFSKTEHRFGEAKEYLRAVRAAKLESLHAKPFVTAFDGHVETVTRIVKVRNKLPIIVSCDLDGELRCWDISQHLLNWRVQAHKGRILGCTVTNSSLSSDETNTSQGNNLVVTSGLDKTLKIWNLALQGTARAEWVRDDSHSSISGLNGDTSSSDIYSAGDQKPLHTIHHFEPLHCVDACWESGSSMFASGSSCVSLWDVNRSHSLHRFDDGIDQVNCMAFNPTNYQLLSASTQDRKICFYDTRTKNALPYITTHNWSNEISWNPIDPKVFLVASNDWNLYTFDMRFMKRAVRTHRGHVEAVMGCDWSPTGDEFVSGAVDGHIRLWKATHQTKDAPRTGYSRELYKGRRMYNLHTVRWTWDRKFILSGSADGAIRLWKARRSEPLKKLHPNQKIALNYSEQLKEKYQHMTEVGTIWKFRKAKIRQRIPRNGVFYQKERAAQSKIKDLRKKLKNETRRDADRIIQKKMGKPWASQVVVNSGIVHENLD